MKTLQTDVAIIGAGTAGLAAYRAAKAAGATAALIEDGPYGTTCARVGCMPSKLLIAAAEAAHAAAEIAHFGIHIDGAIRIDGHQVMDRVKSERDRFVGFVLRRVEHIPAQDRLRGHARFIDNHTLDIDGQSLLSAKSIVIAAGSSATYPDAFKALGDRLIINDDVFNWADLPKSVAVIGTGIIGLELGQALQRLGVQVVVLGRSGSIGHIGDPEINAQAIEVFSQEFRLETNTVIEALWRQGDQAVIRRKGPNDSTTTEYVDYVLVATGRTPNVDALDLQNTSVTRDRNGVPLFDPSTARTKSTMGTTGIFIAGDVSNFIPLLHEAADEGRIAGENAARFAQGMPLQPGLRRAGIHVVFTDPQIAIVGGGFRALTAGTFATGQVSFKDQGRSRILFRNKGLMHIYGDLDTGRFLGAEMLGPAAEHVGHLLAWALQNQMTVKQMLAMPFYHPVIEEGLRTALRDLEAKLRGH